MDSIVDPLWYRVAELKPRLRLHLRIQRRKSGDRTWYVLCDDTRQSYYRLDTSAYQFVGRLNGDVTVDAAWKATHERLGDQAPTQGEALRILQQLSDDEAIWLGGLGDMSVVLKRKRRRKQLRQSIANPLSMKVSLFDPSALLVRLTPLARRVFSGWGLLLWAALVLWGGAVAVTQASGISSGLSLNAHTSAFLLQMWFLYPLVKVIHEASHAMAVRRWGGTVREAGVNVVMLTPLPYVDASAANGFGRRGPRLLVSAAGVMAELAIAAAAIVLWSASNSQTVQQAALAIVAGCGISTLLFNANPLARFDGYYVLCDLLDMPNISARGNRMVAHWFECALGRGGERPSPEESRRDAVIVTGYALLSWCYQALVTYGLAYWLYDTYPRLAALLGLMGGVLLLKRPVSHALAYILLDFHLTGRRLRAVGIFTSMFAALAAALFLAPAPSFTVQQGVVWAPSDSILRADTPGELKDMRAKEGDHVKAGQLIAVLDNLELRSQRASAVGRLQELELRYFEALLRDPLEARKLGLERASTQGLLAHLDEQLEDLEIRAQVDGSLVVHRDNVQSGHYFAQGQEIGYVIPERPQLVVKVALSEAQAALVRATTRDVSVRLDPGRSHALPATLERETPNAVRAIPSAALSSVNGGPVPTDPSDPQALRTLGPVDIVDVAVDNIPTSVLGARAWVRFDHPHEPLGVQWYRSITQAFLSRLGLGV